MHGRWPALEFELDDSGSRTNVSLWLSMRPRTITVGTLTLAVVSGLMLVQVTSTDESMTDENRSSRNFHVSLSGNQPSFNMKAMALSDEAKDNALNPQEVPRTLDKSGNPLLRSPWEAVSKHQDLGVGALEETPALNPHIVPSKEQLARLDQLQRLFASKEAPEQVRFEAMQEWSQWIHAFNGLTQAAPKRGDLPGFGASH
jgi:hypothetical protein